MNYIKKEKTMKITLETNRLILRPFTLEDAFDMYHNWANDPKVTKYLTWNPHQNIEETKSILNQWIKLYEKPERISFAIVLKDTKELIGSIDVCGYIEGVPVIGYALSKKHWNHGYMTEACKKVISYLFLKGYQQVRIDAMVENIASNKVIQKCGGKYLDTIQHEFPLKNKTVLIHRYLIQKDDFIAE